MNTQVSSYINSNSDKCKCRYKYKVFRCCSAVTKDEEVDNEQTARTDIVSCRHTILFLALTLRHGIKRHEFIWCSMKWLLYQGLTLSHFIVWSDTVSSVQRHHLFNSSRCKIENLITISQILAWSIVLIGRYDTGTAGPKNPTKPMQRQIQLQINPSENCGLAHSFVRKMQIQKQIQIQIQIISSDKFGFEHSFDRQMQI